MKGSGTVRIRMLCLVALLAVAPARAATPAVSAGDRFSVALHSDGTVSTWGIDSSDELGLGRTLFSTKPVVVLGLSNVSRVSSGVNHVVARLRDGTVVAWGENDHGQLGDGTQTSRSTPAPVQGLSGIQAIAAGYDHTLAVAADGSVWSWGIDYKGQLGYDDAALVPQKVPGVSNIIAVAAGNGFSLALDRDGTLWGWGGNDNGELGDGTTTAPYTGRSNAVPVKGIAGVVKFSAGGEHSAAVTSNGLVYTWGRNDSGQLGNGHLADTNLPQPVAGITNAIDVSAGDDHTVVLLSDGTAVAFGDNYEGQLGDGTGTPSPTFVHAQGLSNAFAVATGVFFSVALTRDGSVWAWGWNDEGQMANGGNGTNVYAPARVTGLPLIASIAGGGSHAFAVATNGQVLAWGANDFGELGDGAKPLSSTPEKVGGVSSIIGIAAGGTHTLALKSDGTLMAWGANWASQLGDGTTDPHSSAIAVAGPGGLTQIVAGYYYSAALRSDGTVWTWGEGYSGPLGQGDQDNRSVPTQVPGLSNVKGISAGASHMLAVLGDGTVRAWGGNGDGELGDGSTTDRVSPIVVTGLASVKAVAAGAQHSLALRTDGTVWAWGQNYSGELGDGTNTPRPVPGQVIGISNVVSIAAGDSYSLAVTGDGSVWAWGANWGGQLGEGSGLSQTHPVKVALPTGIASVSAGRQSALAIRNDGTAWAWGDNVNGTLGDGTFASRDIPVIVVREDGTGSLETNDWFLDLNPAIAKSIPADRIPVFLVVTQSASGAVTATVKFRGQDVGSTANIYIFAVAPASSVKGAAAKKAQALGFARKKDGTKDGSDPCVLTQLGSSGQLTQASASSLQAYASGVLNSQGQAVTILGSGAQQNAAGATLYVGYGTSSSSMIANGTNRSAITVPGTVTCQPQAPQTGWWWNPAEPGRGYSIEEQGSHIFFAAFHYDASGRATWNVASGATSLDGSLFTGDLLSVSGGQTLGGAYNGFPAVSRLGDITLNFTDASHGTMTWPGGTVPIQRQPFTPDSLDAAALPNQPESGWWWNPNESGRGFFIEWQGAWVDFAGYMYDDGGNPVWYIGVYQLADPRNISGTWWSYANGQSMLGPYKPATQTSSNVAPVTITFSAPDTAIMTLPNNRTTALTRQRY